MMEMHSIFQIIQWQWKWVQWEESMSMLDSQFKQYKGEKLHTTFQILPGVRFKEPRQDSFYYLCFACPLIINMFSKTSNSSASSVSFR